MAARRRGPIGLKSPYLRRVWIQPDRMPATRHYPFSLPYLDGFEIAFDRPITIIVGENGTGKSTLLEAIAALAGYDRAGGGKGYRPADHSLALAADGSDLAPALRASWLPKITDGWFFRAESFYTVARYLDDAAREPFSGPPPDYLSHSHGEGFLRFFTERCRRQGLFIFDEPESALSPARRSSSCGCSAEWRIPASFRSSSQRTPRFSWPIPARRSSVCPPAAWHPSPSRTPRITGSRGTSPSTRARSWRTASPKTGTDRRHLAKP